MWLVEFVSMPALTSTSPIGSLFIDHRASHRIYLDLQRTIPIKLNDKFISELKPETNSNNKFNLDIETTASRSETLLPNAKDAASLSCKSNPSA